MLPGLEACRFDMVAGPATVTKARAERYRFVGPIAEATAALPKRDGDETVTKPEDIAGKLVGAGTKSYSGYIGSKKPENQAPLDAVQAAIVKIKKDGRMAALREKWFGAAFETPDEVPVPAL